jgi:LAS superfamily LD-carboxypeptidase LdcB
MKQVLILVILSVFSLSHAQLAANKPSEKVGQAQQFATIDDLLVRMETEKRIKANKELKEFKDKLDALDLAKKAVETNAKHKPINLTAEWRKFCIFYNKADLIE